MSLMVGILAALTSSVIGIAVGAIAGFMGGKIDDVLMRITELFQVMPKFFLALMIAFFFGPSVWNIIFVIGILSWPSTCRLVRAEFLSLKEQEFVLAARSIGARKSSIIFNEILPNASPPVIVNASLQVASAILIEATLSFFGLGDPSWVSWGRMLYDAQRLLRVAWWVSFFPGASIFLVVLGLNLVGDGMNDALNPRLRET
jgi:peptide/nickel transport system permease protein